MRHLTLKPDEIRTGEDGTLEFDGIAVPYDTEIVYAGIRESFARGAFDIDGLPGTPILYCHDRQEQIGQIIAADDTAVGVAITGRILAATTRGGDAIALMRDGALRGLSVGFEPLDHKATANGIQYTRAVMHELSTTPLPAYGKHSTVTAVREEAPVMQTEAPAPDARDTIDLAPINDRLDALETRMADRAAPAPRTLGVREALVMQLRASAESRNLRALADVVSSGNAGVLPPAWSSEVVSYVDSMRYMIPRAGSMGFPSSGHSLSVPNIASHTLVAARGAEKSQIPSAALTTDSETYNAAWFAGGVDVSLEVIWQSDPSVWSLVVEDLMAQYAIATDSAVTTAAEAAATAESALDTTSYAALVADLIAGSETIRAATGAPGDQVAATTGTWKSILGMVADDGRRLFATTGATNADGSAALTAQSVNIGGIQVAHNPRASVDLHFNTKALRFAEKPPVTLTSDNVALMGRDVGVLGAIIALPLYPAGILKYATI